MRFLTVGLILTLLQSMASAQVSGFVEAVGFNNTYRPNTWTPILINLTSQNPTAQDYQIQIVQQDLDKDNVTYTRDITLNANTQQKFWAYFIPQPTDHGLPGTSMDQLQKVLQVYLATRPDSSGRTKQIAPIPIRLTLNNIDPGDDNGYEPRGQRLLLWITDGASRPAGLDLQQLSGQVIGTKEDIQQVGLKPGELPENALGYDAVDTILWLDANSGSLDEAGARRLEAIEQFVRRGGQLVVCQPPQIHKLDALAPMLPIELSDATMRDTPSLDPLRQLSLGRGRQPDDQALWDLFHKNHPFQFAHATPRSDAVVDPDQWIDWKGDGSDKTPMIARRGWGMGSVTWVACDLGDPAISSALPRWPAIWNHVMGWNDATIVNPDKEQVARYETPVSSDLSAFLSNGTDLEGRGAGLIGIAIIFFVLYWIVVGPGCYLILSKKKKTELSWFVFGGASIAVAALTPLVVRLVLAGGGDLKHVSVERLASGEPTHVVSRIGLYLTHDGYQDLSLADNSPDGQSAISALIIHPREAPTIDYPASQDYTVAVRESDQPVQVSIPFRSTLKKLEVRWVGNSAGGILGTPRLQDPSGEHTRGKYIDGKLVNQSGQTLFDVYFGFHHPTLWKGHPANWVLYVPQWKNGDTIDLDQLFNDKKKTPLLSALFSALPNPDWRTVWAKGTIDDEWARYWDSYFDEVGNSDMNAADARGKIPLLTFFDLIPTPENDLDNHTEKAMNIIRRDGRGLNLSGAMLGGKLVIVGHAEDSALPCPLDLNGSRLQGTGLDVVQAVLPIDASAFAPQAMPRATANSPAPTKTEGGTP